MVTLRRGCDRYKIRRSMLKSSEKTDGWQDVNFRVKTLNMFL